MKFLSRSIECVQYEGGTAEILVEHSDPLFIEQAMQNMAQEI